MSTIILLALALALVHIWLLPAALNLNNFNYLISNRAGTVKTSPAYDRVARASTNFQESLPAFLALCLLSMHLNIDIEPIATYWLMLRVAFLASYALGVIYIRTVFWLGSLACLVMMGMQLL